MQRITPFLFYDDVSGARDFLADAFGFRTCDHLSSHDDPSSHSHVEMELDDGDRIMMRAPRHEHSSQGTSPQSMTRVEVDDIDAHFTRACAAHAAVIRPLAERHQGERGYEAADPEGQRWYFVQRQPASPTAD